MTDLTMQETIRQLKILKHAKSVIAGHLLHRRNIYVPGFHEKPPEETHWQFAYARDDAKDLYYFFVPREMSEVEAYKATKEYVDAYREVSLLEKEIHNRSINFALNDVDDTNDSE